MLLTTGELRTFATNFSVESVGQRLDEFEDVGVAACLFDLFLGDFAGWLGSTKENVEADSAGVESRFLRHESDVLSVVVYIESRDVNAVEL